MNTKNWDVGEGHNDPGEQRDFDPDPLQVAVRLSRKDQIAAILDTAERCGDIVEDVDALPGSGELPALLGIRAVAEQQRIRLRNLAANMLYEDGTI